MQIFIINYVIIHSIPLGKYQTVTQARTKPTTTWYLLLIMLKLNKPRANQLINVTR